MLIMCYILESYISYMVDLLEGEKQKQDHEKECELRQKLL